MNDLKVWADDTDMYVAESIERAMEMQLEMTGSNPCPREKWHEATWRKLTIDLDDGRGGVTKTLPEWIAENGPGMLCSSEC